MSEATFANRHAVDVFWSKPQDVPQRLATADVELAADQFHLTFTMVGIATPDLKQSEAYAATAALFHIFSTNAKEEKVGLRLPPAWRDLWFELAEAKKNMLDAEDRTVVRGLRALVRQRRDQELEDGVILQGAFRGRGAAKSSQDAGENGTQDRSKHNANGGDVYRKIWADKSSTRKFQTMLVRGSKSPTNASLTSLQQSRMQLPMWHFKEQVLSAVDQNQVVIVCGETGW